MNHDFRIVESPSSPKSAPSKERVMGDIRKELHGVASSLRDLAGAYQDACDEQREMEALAYDVDSILASLPESGAWYPSAEDVSKRLGGTGGALDGSATEQASALGDIRAALAACVAQWRGMESAPRDGRSLLLCRAGHVMPFTGYWSQPDLSWVDTDGNMRDPTHWQPLPTPPIERETK